MMKCAWGAKTLCRFSPLSPTQSAEFSYTKVQDVVTNSWVLDKRTGTHIFSFMVHTRYEIHSQPANIFGRAAYRPFEQKELWKDHIYTPRGAIPPGYSTLEGKEVSDT